MNLVPLLLTLVGYVVSAVVAQASTDLTALSLQNAKSQLVTPLRSIDSIFVRYPSSVELDEIILTADSLSILKLVQNLVSDKSLTCTQVMAYLLEIDGRIKSAIEVKTFASDQLSVIIYAAEREIKRLERQISRLNGDEAGLFLQRMKRSLASLTEKLNEGYKRYNSALEGLPQLQASIQTKNIQIDELEIKATQARDRVLNGRLTVSETDSEIRQLQAKLAQAKKRKNDASNDISFNQRLQTDLQIAIRNNRNDISNFERQIRNIKNQADSIKKGFRDIEVEAERIRQEIAQAEQERKEITLEIQKYENLIRQEENKLVYDDLKELRNMIEDLRNLQPGVTYEINRNYYFCYGDGKVQIQQTGSVTVYIIQGNNFAAYLSNAYGIQDTPVFSTSPTIRLQPLDIFTTTWKLNYGTPFNNQTLQKTDDIAMLGDFWCLNPSALTSGYGQIIDITPNSFTITSSSGNNLTLRLSTCSRMETAVGSLTPRRGQNILWRGVPAQKNIINMYTCTFI